MQLSSKQKISIISGIIALLVGIGVWYFFPSDEYDVLEATEVTPVAPESADDIRIRHINLIGRSLRQALSRGSEIPLPEEALQVDFEEITLVYQGKAGKDLFDFLGLNDLVDPATNARYDFALSADKKEYEIVAYLDDVQRSNMHLDKAVFYSAGSESDLFVRDFAGSIVNRSKAWAAIIDIASSEIRKKTGIPTLKSCKDIYAFKSTIATPKSGTYIIDIDGRDTKVFCDMQTDGGGWTLFYANNGYEDSPIAKSYVDMRDTMKTDPILDLSNYDNKHLAWLLDFTHFTEQWASEVLIRNRTGDIKKWAKFTFSTSRALEWALGPLVLWKTENGCVVLPRRATWSIQSNDAKVRHEKLTQIMNHAGTSWGVSHEKYPCNFFVNWSNPHIAFYTASRADYINRARSNDVVNGNWWKGNEYRYFIR